jgi:DNA-binding response OmpR family regulator
MEGGRILVVDDDKSILRFMRSILERNHYIVNIADTAREAILLCENKIFDLALIDIVLPDMTGIELLGRLHAYQMVKIIVTGFPSQQNSIDAINLGADGYLLKPIKPVYLLDTIKNHLDKHRLESENKYEIAIGLMGEFLNIFQENQEWYKIEDIARRLYISENMTERMTYFSIKRGLLKIKYWKEKGIIQTKKPIIQQSY